MSKTDHQYWWSHNSARRNGRLEAARSAATLSARREDGLASGRNGTGLLTSQDAMDYPACRQCPQPDIGNPLEVRSGSAESDESPAADGSGQDGDSGSAGFSQFISNIFEQLSITSWLPAAMLIGNAAVLLQLRADHNYNVARAVRHLAGKPLGTLIILIFALILATIVTQAFEFEIIQLLEGYLDSARRPVQALMAIRVRRHSAKLLRLNCKFQKSQKDALLEAIQSMRGHSGYNLAMLDALEEKVKTQAVLDDEVLGEADELRWRDHLPAYLAYRIDGLDALMRSYPEKSRVMPTRLGNVLRAAEDQVDLESGETLVGFVIRHYDELPHAVRKEHKDYRNRLNMYCSLALVYFALAAMSIGLLYSISPTWGIAIAASGYGIMSYVAYEAAITSARGYGIALLEVSGCIERQRQSAEADESSSTTDELSTFARFRALLHRNPV